MTLKTDAENAALITGIECMTGIEWYHRYHRNRVNVIEIWGYVYFMYNGKQPLGDHHWQLTSHSLATKQCTLATV